MALKNLSMFLYGFQVTSNNRSIDFKIISGGTEQQATLTLGYYSLSSLAAEIKRAMESTDPTHTYTVTVDRTFGGGTQNRVTIATSGSFLTLLFLTGSRAASSVASLIGFPSLDRTGFIYYQGTSSAGTRLIPNLVGYSYLPPTIDRQNFGIRNVSASGIKETIVYSTQSFWRCQFKYIPEVTATIDWSDLMTWMIAQKPIEFTPDVNTPAYLFEGTLESTPQDGTNGMMFSMMEMLPKFPFQYDTGMLKFRVRSIITG